MTWKVGPNGFEGEAVVVTGAVEGAEERPEVLAVGAKRGAVLVFGDMGVADERADLEDILGGFAVAEHMKNIDEQFDAGGVSSPDGLSALENGINEVALAAVEGFDDEGDAIFLRERTELAEEIDVLLEPSGKGESGGDHACARAAENDERHADFLSSTKHGLCVAVEAGVVDGRATAFQGGGQEDVRGGHGITAVAQGGSAWGEVGVRGLGGEKVNDVALDKIAVGAGGKTGHGGGVGAKADFHRGCSIKVRLNGTAKMMLTLHGRGGFLHGPAQRVERTFRALFAVGTKLTARGAHGPLFRGTGSRAKIRRAARASREPQAALSIAVSMKPSGGPHGLHSIGTRGRRNGRRRWRQPKRANA